MKRTLADIRRHGELLGRVVDYFDKQMAGLGTEERRYLTRELTIAGLAKIGYSEGGDSFYEAIDEASDRAIQFCSNVKTSTPDTLFTDGAINPKLRKVE